MAQVRIGGDTGHPVATYGPDDKRAADFYTIAKLIVEKAAEASSVAGPTITISD